MYIYTFPANINFKCCVGYINAFRWTLAKKKKKTLMVIFRICFYYPSSLGKNACACEISF